MNPTTLARGPRTWLFYAPGFALASVFRTGFPVVVENNAFQVPLVHWLADRSLYRHDLLGASFSTYDSILWPAVAWLAQHFTLTHVLIALSALERLLLVVAVGAVATVLSRGALLPVVASMAAFSAWPPQPLFGCGTITAGYLEQTGFSIPFFLFAFAALFARRPIVMAAFLTIGFYLQPMYGVFAFAFLGAGVLALERRRGRLAIWIAALVVAGVACLPEVVRHVRAGWGKPVDAALWLQVMRVSPAGTGCHLFPDRWGPSNYARFIGLVALVVWLLRSARRDEPARSLFFAWTWAMIGLIAVNVVALLSGSISLLMLQWGRASDLWLSATLIALLAAGAMAGPRGRIVRWDIALAAALWLVLQPRGPAGLVLAALGAAFLVPAIRSRIVVPGRGQRAPALVLASALFAGVFGAPTHPPFVSSGVGATVMDVATWARSETRPDEVLLAPPGTDWLFLRAESQRPVYLSVEDFAAGLWAPWLVPQWKARVEALGATIVPLTRKWGLPHAGGKQDLELDRAFERLTDADVGRLARDYGVAYWIVAEDRATAFPTVYRSSAVRVVRVMPSTVGD